MATYIESTDVTFNTQLKNFVSKIDTHASVLGLSTAEVASIKIDSHAFDYVVTNHVAIQSFAQNYTAFKSQLKKGGALTLGPLPILPALSAPPLMPSGDIIRRFRALVQRITHMNTYTPAIGYDLGIEASVKVFNPSLGKPVFYIEYVSGGLPQLCWPKGNYDGVEIWKDASNGFFKLDRDIRPNYIDKSPLPPAGITAIWKYKMIYIINDEPVGLWSDVVSITVYGEV
jgi:hypothetical protein